MKMVPRTLFCGALALASLCIAAAEVRVVSTVAARSTLEELKPLFERATSHKLELVFGTAVPLKRRIDGGETFDIAILTPALVDDLAKSGKIDGGSKLDFARSGIALAGRTDGPKPDISTPEKLRKTLAAAGGISYTKEGQSGVAAAKVIERLGLTDELKPRTIVETRSGGSLLVIVEGKVDYGFAIATEIIGNPDVAFIGPMPAELQSYMVLTAAASSSAKEAGAARAFIEFLRSDAARAVMQRKGMEGL